MRGLLIKGVCLQKGWWEPTPFFLFWLHSCHEVSRLLNHMLPDMMYCLIAGLKATRPTDHGLKLSKL